eukprot:gene7826-12300_t
MSKGEETYWINSEIDNYDEDGYYSEENEELLNPELEEYMNKDSDQMKQNLQFEPEKTKKTKRAKKNQAEKNLVQFETVEEKVQEKNYDIIQKEEVKFELSVTEFTKMSFEKINTKVPIKITRDKSSQIQMKQGEYNCTKRSNFAMTLVNKKIFIHGGTNGKLLYSDVISFDITKETWTIHDNILNPEFSPGSCINHKMVTLNNQILVISSAEKKLQYTMISDVADNSMITWGYKSTIKGKPHPINHQGNISKRDSFSLSNFGYEIFLFGGKNGNNILDEFYILDASSVKLVVINKIDSSNAEVYPQARFGHASEIVNGNLVIFGGQNNYLFFNDLFIYDQTNNKWNEIKYEGISPNPVSFPLMTQYYNNSLLIYGGETEDGMIDTFSKYEFQNNKFSVVKSLGVNKSNKCQYDLQIPFSSAGCCIDGNDMYMIGGKLKHTSVNNFLVIHDVNEVGKSFMLCEYLKTLRKDNLFCDFQFTIKDEMTGNLKQMDAHKVVIAARCPNLLNLTDIPNYNETVFSAFLDFIYTGSFQISKNENLISLCKLANEYGQESHAYMISKICSEDFYLSDAQHVADEFEIDFSELLDNQLASDVKIYLANDTVINTHKIILCRSSYFSSMFKSGMIESESNKIEMSDFDKSAILEVLKFLYTDQIHVTSNNCVSVLLISMLFEIREISDYCRTVVSQYLTIHNVAQVLNIADDYFDAVLKRICFNYVKKNIEVLDENLEIIENLNPTN